MSGFLSGEDFEKADGLIRDTFPVEDDGDGFIGEPIEGQEESIEARDNTLDEERSSQSPDEDVKQSSDESEEGAGHRVPYSRFKSVLDARNDYKGEIESLRERNRELENYLSSKPAQKETKQEFEDYSDDFSYGDDLGLDDYSGCEQDDGRVKQLENQMHDLRVQHYKQQLMKDLDVIKERYPSVPPETVLKAVAQDPTTNIFQVAERFNTFVVEREEAAIKRYLEENSQEAPAAAPRPRRSGGAEAPGSSRVSKDKRPKQMKDVRHALLNYVKDNNIF